MRSTECISAQQLVSTLRDEFARYACAKDAVHMKAYMRDQFEFFGLKSLIAAN